jgi:hypothetical protein
VTVAVLDPWETNANIASPRQMRYRMRREEVAVLIRRLPGNEDLDLPQYQSAEAVAMDLQAAVRESARLEPGDILLVPCGFSVALPPGFEAQIRPRSGLAAKYEVTVVNSPGTIQEWPRAAWPRARCPPAARPLPPVRRGLGSVAPAACSGCPG